MSSILGPGRVRTEVVGPEGQSVNYIEAGGGLTQLVKLDQQQGGPLGYVRMTNLASAVSLPRVVPLAHWYGFNGDQIHAESGRVTRLDTSGGWSGAVSVASVPLGSDGILWGQPGHSHRQIFGLHDVRTPEGAGIVGSALYAMEVDSSNARVRVYSEGSGSANLGAWHAWAGQKVGVGVQGGSVQYFVGDSVIHESVIPPATDLFGAVWLEAAIGSEFSNLRLEGSWAGTETTSGWARVFVESGEIRFRDDGGTATPNVGAPWGEGSFFETHNPEAASLIEVVSNSVVTVELH